MEGEGDLGGEAEHGGRVEGDADAPVGELGLFRGGQTVKVEEVARGLGADRADDALHEVEVAQAVLEADDPVGAGELDHGLRGEHGVVALVDDDGQGARGGHLAVVPQQPLLARDHQIRRHRQQSVRTGLLGEPGVADGERGAVAGARHDGDAPLGGLHGRADARLELLRGEGVELSGAAAGEHGGGSGLHPAADMGTAGVEVHGAAGAVGGDGEEQRTAGDTEPGGERG